MGKNSWFVTAALAVVLLDALSGKAQDRVTRVRQDIERFSRSDRWVYNDFARGRQLAQASGKPMLVVFRCVPCEACSEFDKQLIEHEEELSDLLDQFVCVRIIHMNGVDLRLFQFDFDQSMHLVFLHPDGTVYARFGTRSPRPEHEDITLAGLRRAMERVLAWHAGYPANKARFEGKQPRPVEVAFAEQFPTLKGRYGSKLDVQGQVVASCIHCHQVREAQRAMARQSMQKLSDELLFPQPLPDVIGLRMDPNYCARVAEVSPQSPAAEAGLRPGDELEELAGQPLASTADIQWVLHHTPGEAELPCVVRRGDRRLEVTIRLSEGWRQKSDISWRPTTWDLRRQATGGMRLAEVPAEVRRRLGLAPDMPALFVQHVGQYGDHAVAKRAGFQAGDVIVQVDGRPAPQRETDFIAYALSKPAGSTVTAQVRRGQQVLTLRYNTQ
ncbi:MAG: peptidase [Pirellulaceae bacterium]|nr:MAG: peptidase [Pirellulaceae bacterium]